MAAIQEHTGDERICRGKRKNRSINPRSRQKEQPLGGKREVCNNVNDFFFTHSTRCRCCRRRPHSRAALPCRHWIRSNLHFLYILLTQSFIFYFMKNIKIIVTFPILCIFWFYFEL
uniref:Uncharacterized protein n=1 Tax=Schizaphis graminum TaxID=13262 RepID=A0A2S2NX15_SCHGA